MSATVFDTYRIVKRLKDAGFSDHQAETVTDVLSESRSVDMSHLATKADIANLATKADLADAKVDIMKWIVPLMLAQSGFIVALIKLLP